ncbi:hypothetical protein FISHEDRAFT_60477 [Fistulina hepatica ATCC 64428]|uniref:Uncharacterized protein n=1 Tax=Fistulina hepatica ATCC 64428 TaxID=1128425 RepID=A0A0D7A8L2_9AGAR|nr:hypothetical protein FISHEDRAFT_60477 [Fistulina hepatica ATCC 64428]
MAFFRVSPFLPAVIKLSTASIALKGCASPNTHIRMCIGGKQLPGFGTMSQRSCLVLSLVTLGVQTFSGLSLRGPSISGTSRLQSAAVTKKALSIRMTVQRFRRLKTGAGKEGEFEREEPKRRQWIKLWTAEMSKKKKVHRINKGDCERKEGEEKSPNFAKPDVWVSGEGAMKRSNEQDRRDATWKTTGNPERTPPGEIENVRTVSSKQRYVSSSRRSQRSELEHDARSMTGHRQAGTGCEVMMEIRDRGYRWHAHGAAARCKAANTRGTDSRHAVWMPGLLMLHIIRLEAEPERCAVAACTAGAPGFDGRSAIEGGKMQLIGHALALTAQSAVAAIFN